MKEIRDIITQYDRLKNTGQSLALATVFDVKGSSYRRTGARMLITDNGTWFGGISGGCIEGNALKKAQMVMSDGKARIVTYDTENDDESSIGVSLGCNGVISVIIAPINNGLPDNPIEKLRSLLETRKTEVLLTVLETSSDDVALGSVLELADLKKILDSETEVQHFLNDLVTIKESGKSRQLTINSFNVFAEVIKPDIHLIVMGGNYDIFPLLEIAGKLDWKKTVIANTSRLYTPARELANIICNDLEEVNVDDQTVGIVMSHDYHADLTNLRKSLSSSLKYIGVLGPAVRRQDMIDELKSEGIDVDESIIFGPAGLDIGAQQPEEIAVAIVAEVISVLRNRDAKSLRDRIGAIHDR